VASNTQLALGTAEKARNLSQFVAGGAGSNGGHGPSTAGPADGFVPAELAAALTALKAMEVLRPEAGS
jgi:hypothetical protein